MGAHHSQPKRVFKKLGRRLSHVVRDTGQAAAYAGETAGRAVAQGAVATGKAVVKAEGSVKDAAKTDVQSVQNQTIGQTERLGTNLAHTPKHIFKASPHMIKTINNDIQHNLKKLDRDTHGGLSISGAIATTLLPEAQIAMTGGVVARDLIETGKVRKQTLINIAENKLAGSSVIGNILTNADAIDTVANDLGLGNPVTGGMARVKRKAEHALMNAKPVKSSRMVNAVAVA